MGVNPSRPLVKKIRQGSFFLHFSLDFLDGMGYNKIMETTNKPQTPKEAKMATMNQDGSVTFSYEEILAAAEETKKAEAARANEPMMAISYQTPVGTFKDWIKAAERVEALDMDPVEVIQIIRTPIK